MGFQAYPHQVFLRKFEDVPHIMCTVVFSAFVGWSPIIIFSCFVCAGKLMVVSLRSYVYDNPTDSTCLYRRLPWPVL